MPFTVEVEHRLTIVQGLNSPVRTRRGLPPLPPGEGVPLLITAGITFDDAQLTPRGWFTDTDALAEELESCCAPLAAGPWTALFPFRPTFELVARHLFSELSPRVPQLCFVELRDLAFGSCTRYVGAR
jgi:hypothetical protein